MFERSHGACIDTISTDQRYIVAGDCAEFRCVSHGIPGDPDVR